MSTTKNFDFIVIGGGIAGASAAYELSKMGSVVVLEQESQPGFHSTGRSAAIFLETYGNETIRGLTKGSRAFYEAPPQGFASEELMTPRGAVFVADSKQLGELEKHLKDVSILVRSAKWLDEKELLNLVPVLRKDAWVAGVYEPEARDMDVHAIHYGFLKGVKAQGGTLVTDARVIAMGKQGSDWRVETAVGAFTAPIVVNAAGAWGETVAKLAGVAGVGLKPLRRTGVIVDTPAAIDAAALPYFGDIADTFYVKPDGKRLFVSPCDETTSDPCDARPDDYDIAIAMDRLERATTLKIEHLTNKLAGLRSFVADRTPVVGFGAPGFFWLVGQGGYGIQSAPALARATASLVAGRGIPSDLAALGVSEAALSPHRSSLIPSPSRVA